MLGYKLKNEREIIIEIISNNKREKKLLHFS